MITIIWIRVFSSVEQYSALNVCFHILFNFLKWKINNFMRHFGFISQFNMQFNSKYSIRK